MEGVVGGLGSLYSRTGPVARSSIGAGLAGTGTTCCGAVACTNGHTLAKLRALRTRRYTTLRYQRSQLAAQPRRPRRTLAPARPARAQPAAPSAPVRYGYYATPDATTHTTLRYATLLYRRLRRCCSAPARRARPQPLQLEAARRRRRRRLRRVLVRPPRRARLVAGALLLPLRGRRHGNGWLRWGAPWLRTQPAACSV